MAFAGFAAPVVVASEAFAVSVVFFESLSLQAVRIRINAKDQRIFFIFIFLQLQM
jgi:hypothetical protein